MHCEYLLVNDCCNGQAVEAICKGLPQLDIVSSFALIVESIDSVNRSTFVVAAQDEEVFRVFYLVGKEQADRLKRLFASIHIISKEEVVGLRGETAVFEQTEEIIVLAVNVSTYLEEKYKVSIGLSAVTATMTPSESTYLDWRFKFK
jgi:hypothetical protein